MLGRRVLLRLVAAGGGVRSILDARDAQPGARVSSMAVYQLHEAFDAVAGCEYLDDRIRLGE
jgi:hypothetical protein